MQSDGILCKNPQCCAHSHQRTVPFSTRSLLPSLRKFIIRKVSFLNLRRDIVTTPYIYRGYWVYIHNFQVPRMPQSRFFKAGLVTGLRFAHSTPGRQGVYSGDNCAGKQKLNHRPSPSISGQTLTAQQPANFLQQHRPMTIESAIRQWQEILGPENLVHDEASLKRAETATFPTDQRVLAILRPCRTEEAAACLRVARLHRIPVYPVSGSKNWGYGSAVPCADSSALMDLRRMNSILDFDEKLGVMTLEPGVTFQQAYEFLEKRGSGRAITVIGGTPHGSIMGNTLERGIGTGPYGDRALYACDLQVILPNGEIMCTGLSRFENAQAAQLARWGSGPSLDGLFFQSNFGIVTRMTVFLPRKPAVFGAFRLALNDETNFSELVDRLQELRSHRLLESNITIMNDIRMFATYGQYPWSRTGGVTPLPHSLREQMRREQAVGSWNVTSALFVPDDAALSAVKRRVRRALGPFSTHLVFVDKVVDRYHALLRPIWRHRWGLDIDKYLDGSYHRSVYRGVPNSISMNQAYWRKKSPVPKDMDADRDRCGCIWVCPELPFTGQAALEVKRLLDAKFAEFGFDPLISFVGLSEQTLRAVAGIMYDREVPGEDEQALQCYEGMIHDLRESGYYPYRLGIRSMENARSDSKSYEWVVKTLKQALDPSQVLSPGHYVSSDRPSIGSGVTIRVLAEHELEQLSQFRRGIWLKEVHGDDTKLPEWLTHDNFDTTATHWGAFENDRLIGAARLCCIKSALELSEHDMYKDVPKDLPFPICVMERMVISPEARHLGLATRLDAIRVVHAARIGAKVVLTACPSYRTGCFRSLGFEAIMETRDSFENTTLEPPTIMKLDLGCSVPESKVLGENDIV